jgi:hypothetical protein
MDSKKGEVVEIKQDIPPVPSVPSNIEIATKPKRPLSDAQRENLKKLIERNRLRRLEIKKQAEVCKESLPEIEKPIKVKRNYKHDIERKVVADRLSSLEELMKGFTANFRNQDIKGNTVAVPPPSASEKERKPKKPTKPKRPATPTTTDCETDFTETETDTEDERSKYVRKAQKRIETVKQIEQQLQRPTNRYSNMSIF